MMHITHWAIRAMVTMAALVSTVLLVILTVDPTASSIDDVSSGMAVRATLFFTALISAIAAIGMHQEYVLISELNVYLGTMLWREKIHNISLDDERHALLSYESGTFKVEVTYTTSLQRIMFVVNHDTVEIYQSLVLEIPLRVDADGSYVGKLDSIKLDKVLIDYKREMRLLIDALKDLTPP